MSYLLMLTAALLIAGLSEHARRFERVMHLGVFPTSDQRGRDAALRRPTRVVVRWIVRASTDGPPLLDSAARCPYRAKRQVQDTL